MAKPRYRGERDFKEVPGGFRLTTDEIFGLDRASVTYMGSVDRLRSFNAKFKVGDPIPSGTAKAKMYLVGRAVESTGAYSRVTYFYEGSWDSKERDPIVTRSVQVQSATVGTDDERDPPVNLQYRAQIVTARYFVLGTSPTSPRGFGFLPSELQATPFNYDPPPSSLEGKPQFKFVARNILFEVEDVVDQKLYRVTEQQSLELTDDAEPD